MSPARWRRPASSGVIRPAVYLTPGAAADPVTLTHSVVHELTHFRHGDHVWSLLRCLCLVLHWYNPLVWLAAALSRRDAELACDEATIRRLGEAERAAYGRTLIGITCGSRPSLLRTGTTMNFGKSGLRERISLIVKRPKTAALGPRHPPAGRRLCNRLHLHRSAGRRAGAGGLHSQKHRLTAARASTSPLAMSCCSRRTTHIM